MFVCFSGGLLSRGVSRLLTASKKAVEQIEEVFYLHFGVVVVQRHPGRLGISSRPGLVYLVITVDFIAYYGQGPLSQLSLTPDAKRDYLHEDVPGNCRVV